MFSTWFGYVLFGIIALGLIAAAIVLFADISYMVTHKRKSRKKAIK